MTVYDRYMAEIRAEDQAVAERAAVIEMARRFQTFPRTSGRPDALPARFVGVLAQCRAVIPLP